MSVRAAWKETVPRLVAPRPPDAWQAEQTQLVQLQQWELLVLDDHGDVRLPPHIHYLVYERIPAESRPSLHLQAVQIREARGEYSVPQ